VLSASRNGVALAEEDRRRRLTEVIPAALRALGTVDTLLATGKPDQEVLRVAAEKNSDLIVRGSRPRTNRSAVLRIDHRARHSSSLVSRAHVAQ
jgi:nucleotide-binding universal stress UspA family protein